MDLGGALHSKFFAFETGLKNFWSLDFKHVNCETDCLELVDLLNTDWDVDRYWSFEGISLLLFILFLGTVIRLRMVWPSMGYMIEDYYAYGSLLLHE
jgi:hypothetical protein